MTENGNKNGPEEIKILGEKMTSYNFPEDFVTIGRASCNRISIKNRAVSRKHCIIVRDHAQSYRVIDLASTSGTYVNGERVVSKKIGPEDVIKVGPAVLFFNVAPMRLSAFFNEKGEYIHSIKENSTEEADTDTNLPRFDDPAGNADS